MPPTPAARFAARFVEDVHPGQSFELERLHASADAPDLRQVHLLHVGAARYCLKHDLEASETGRISEEFEVLQFLTSHFSGSQTARVVAPVYRDRAGQCLITRFCDAPTVRAVLTRCDTGTERHDVFRRVGSWLHALHDCVSQRETKFWPGWILEAVDKRRAAGPLAPRAQAAPMIDGLRRELARLRGRPQMAGFAHGDFHGGNLLLGARTCTGLDFSGTSNKLLLYDIVDFFKDALLHGANDAVAACPRDRAAFFDGYRHAIDHTALDAALYGGALIDWLSITPEIAARSPYQRRKYERLGAYLSRHHTH